MAAGLDWLARHEPDGGGWDADGFPARCAAGGEPCAGIGKGQHGEEGGCPFDAAITGLAVLAFLGAGHGPWVEGDPLGAVVERGLARLSRATRRVGAPDRDAGGGGGGGDGPDPARRAEARARAERLLAMRREDGGWGYVGEHRDGSDVPYTALVVGALVTARDAGDALPAALAAGVDRFLDSLEADAAGSPTGATAAARATRRRSRTGSPRPRCASGSRSAATGRATARTSR